MLVAPQGVVKVYAQIFDKLPVGYQLFITSARGCGRNLEILGSRFDFGCQAVERLAEKKRFVFPRVKPEVPAWNFQAT